MGRRRSTKRKGAWSRLRDRRLLANILSAPELRRAFREERARVDRTDRACSVVVFRPVAGDLRDLPDAVRVLADRARISDRLGVLDDSRIAVLMPETDRKGAGTFVRSVNGELLAQGLCLEGRVYCYPEDWGGSSDGSGKFGP